jgi:hypothetical protein
MCDMLNIDRTLGARMYVALIFLNRRGQGQGPKMNYFPYVHLWVNMRFWDMIPCTILLRFWFCRVGGSFHLSFFVNFYGDKIWVEFWNWNINIFSFIFVKLTLIMLLLQTLHKLLFKNRPNVDHIWSFLWFFQVLVYKFLFFFPILCNG